MSERDNIFTRIREALTVEAHAHHGTGLPTREDHRRVMPPVGATIEEQFALFAKNAADLRTTFKQVKDPDELTAQLRALRDTEKWQRVATHKSQLAQAHARELGLPTLVTDGGYDKHALEQCDVGISECDALIAQTGTVLVTSKTAGGRAA